MAQTFMVVNLSLRRHGLSGKAILLRSYLTCNNSQVKYVASKIFHFFPDIAFLWKNQDIASENKYLLNVLFPFHTHTQAEWPLWWAENSPLVPTRCKPQLGRCTWLLASGFPQLAEATQAGTYSMLVLWEMKVSEKDYFNINTFSQNLS